MYTSFSDLLEVLDRELHIALPLRSIVCVKFSFFFFRSRAVSLNIMVNMPEFHDPAPESTSRGGGAHGNEIHGNEPGIALHNGLKDSKEHGFDPNFTQNVINATGPRASPRLKQIMPSLIRHVHDFARENKITFEEWMAGVEMVLKIVLFLP